MEVAEYVKTHHTQNQALSNDQQRYWTLVALTHLSDTNRSLVKRAFRAYDGLAQFFDEDTLGGSLVSLHAHLAELTQTNTSNMPLGVEGQKDDQEIRPRESRGLLYILLLRCALVDRASARNGPPGSPAWITEQWPERLEDLNIYKYKYLYTYTI